LQVERRSPTLNPKVQVLGLEAALVAGVLDSFLLAGQEEIARDRHVDIWICLPKSLLGSPVVGFINCILDEEFLFIINDLL
jgi:hypothetical protein